MPFQKGWKPAKNRAKARSMKELLESRQSVALLSPLAAIRRKCLECSLSKLKVRLCPVTGCHLWPYRFGSRKRAKAIVNAEIQNMRENSENPASNLDEEEE